MNANNNKGKNKSVNNNNNVNILANAVIDYIACVDSVSNICNKYNITRNAFYRYKNKLASFYNIDYDLKHKQSKKALYSFLMMLEHIDNLAKSNNTLLNYVAKAFYNNVRNMLNNKNHNKLSNNISKLANSGLFNDVLANDEAFNGFIVENKKVVNALNSNIKGF